MRTPPVVVAQLAVALAGAAVLAATSCAGSPLRTRMDRARGVPSAPFGVSPWLQAPRASCDAPRAALVDDGLALDLDARPAGLVASPSTPDRMWLVVDDRLAAIDEGGALRAVVEPALDGPLLDDPAAGPCPDFSGPCLYVASAADDALVVAALREPATTGEPAALEGETLFTYRFVVDGAAPDVGALIVASDLSLLGVVERAAPHRAWIAPAPFAPDEVVELQAAGALPLDDETDVVGADLHPAGDRLVVRTAAGLHEARVEGAATWADGARWWFVEGPARGGVAYGVDGTSVVGVALSDDAAALVRWPCASSGGA